MTKMRLIAAFPLDDVEDTEEAGYDVEVIIGTVEEAEHDDEVATEGVGESNYDDKVAFEATGKSNDYEDDSDIESLLERHRREMVEVLLAVKEYKDRNQKRRRGSIVGDLCIPYNRQLGNKMLMQDYFAENPTYLLHLFRRRYRMRDPSS
ncbi:DNA-directed RNA polymerase 3, chloroplastic [Hordeum vulgare]|nr:DNA-directed RNA polymerase 3, chloroplastic [Hordeum vulgare]